MRTTNLVVAATLALLTAGCTRDGSQSGSPATQGAATVAAIAPTGAAQGAATVAAAAPTGAPQVSGVGRGETSWIDKELVAWNAPGLEIPKAPVVGVDDATKARCAKSSRPSSVPEDKLVTDAGWTLFGPLQMFATSTMVSGMAAVDANCRPRFMQTFVFTNGRYAGTIAPAPMDSRTDGAQRYAFMPGDDYVVAEFARYAPADPLCCPSRFSTVIYSIKSDEPGKPVLVPVQVTTQEAARQKADLG